MKSAHRVLRAKNVLHAHLVKTANHVANVKSVFANCASLWTLFLSLRQQQWLPKKNVQPVHRVKNVNHVLRAKNVHHAKYRQLPLLKTKKHCPAKHRPWKSRRKTPKAIVHAAAHVVSVVAATVANVNAMPMAT